MQITAIGAAIQKHRPGRNPWLTAILERRPKNVATVALAQRNAHVLWAMLANGTSYQPKLV